MVWTTEGKVQPKSIFVIASISLNPSRFQVLTFGCGADGQLGHGGEQLFLLSPRVVSSLHGVQVVGAAAGARHTGPHRELTLTLTLSVTLTDIPWCGLQQGQSSHLGLAAKGS